MPNYISKIQLPSNGVYDIRDAHAWDASENGSLQKQINDLADAVAGGVTFIVAWAGTAAPTVANIPAGVKVYYNDTEYTGTLAAASATAGAFYMVKSSTQSGVNDFYDEYVVVTNGSTKSWEKIGDTQVNIGGTDVVLGEGTTFTNASSSVSFSGGTTDVVLGEGTTFTASGTAVGNTTKYLSASASGTAVGADGTASAVTGYQSPNTSSFLRDITVQTVRLGVRDISEVTNVGSASSWSFAMGTGTGNTETLIISGGNGSVPTLSSPIQVATGTVSQNELGDSIVGDVLHNTKGNAITALGTPSTATVLTGVKVTTQPTISLTANDSTATGRITYVQSLGTVTQPTITVGTNDKVTAVTGIGTGTASAQTITVGTNDKVTVLTPAT